MESESKSKLREMMNASEDQADAIGVSIEQVQAQIDETTEQANAIDEGLMDDAAYQLAVYLYGKALEFEHGYSYEGFWKTDTSYGYNDSVSTLGGDATSVEGQFVCILGHTSHSSNEPGVGANWETYWEVAEPLSEYRVNLGAGYNQTTISGWKIQRYTSQIITNPTPPPPTITIWVWVTVYEYQGVGWDNDTNIEGWQDDWDFGCDYLHHPLGVEADEDNSPDCVLRVAEGVSASYGLYPKIEALNSAKTILTNNQTKVSDSGDVFDRYLED